MSSLNDLVFLSIFAGLSFILSYFFLRLFSKVAVKLNLVDAPTSRKSHKGEIPLVGGISIFLATLFPVLFCSTCNFPHINWLLSLSFFLLVIGIVDDRIHLSSSIRFVVQILLSLGMVYGAGNMLTSFGTIGFGGEVLLGIFAVPLTVFATVGVINSMNMIDGLDGLSGGLAFIAFSFVAVMMFEAARIAEFSFLLIFLAAIFGFLLSNARWFGRKKASVFLGDAGSTFIGFVFAWVVIDGSQGVDKVMSPVTVLYFFALPLFDTVGVMLRRILKRQSPFHPDHTHLHHIFLRAGFTHKKTVKILHFIAIILGLAGYLGYKLSISENAMFFGFLALFALYFFSMMRAWKIMKFLHTGINVVIEND